MNIVRDIQPISVLRRKSADLLAQLAETGEPVVLTVNGEPKAVIQDAASYQELVDAVERLEAILAIRTAQREVDEGQTIPLAQAVEELRSKHGFQS